MIAFLISCCVSVDVIRRWKNFPYPDNKVYDASFKLLTSSDPKSNDYVNVTTDGHHYGDSYESNVIDGDRSKFWESSNKLAEKCGVIHLNLSFKGHEMKDITRITMLGRQSAHKGFPMTFDIFISENETTDLKLLCSVDLSSVNYQQYAQFDVPKSTFGFMQFKITKVEGTEDRPNIAEIGFYIADRVDILKGKLFTDGTWSKMGITEAEAREFLDLVPKYPLKDQLQNEYRVLKDVIMNGEELQKSIFELDDMRGFVGGAQHSASIYELAPLGVYLQSGESLEIFCDYDTVNKPHAESLKFLDKNDDFKSGYHDLNNGYNKFTAQKINMTDTMTRSFIALLYAGYKGHPNDKRSPKCRISGGMRYPLYDARKDDPCEFEKKLVSYNKYIDCNRYNFMDLNKKSKFDIAVLRGNRTAVITTASSLLQQMESNRKLGRSFKDDVHVWERLPEQYDIYDGFSITDPDPSRHNISSAMHLSILIAETGKPYAWADGYFTGFNNGNPPANNSKCIEGGDWASMLPNYKSFTDDGWGFYHEWGHIYDNNQVVCVESTNNMYSMMMERYFDVRPSRIEKENRYNPLYDFKAQPANIDIWAELVIMHQLEMFMGQDKFHPQFMRYLRDGEHLKYWYDKDLCEGDSRWPYAASLFSGYDVVEGEYTQRGFVWEATHAYIDPVFKNLSLKRLPSTVKYINDRFQYNLEVSDQKGCNLDKNNKPFIKQMRAYNGKAYVTFGVTGIENEFVEILGYELKNDTGVERFIPFNSIDLPLDSSLEYVVMPVTLKLRRLPPVKISVNTNFDGSYADQTGWTVDSYPSGFQGIEGTNIPNIIDGDEKTCYMSDKTMTVPHGFIVDLGKETEFYGFKYSVDSHSYGHGKYLSIEYSLDNETWTQFPKFNNATFVLDNPPYSNQPKYQVYDTPFKAKYIRTIQYGDDTMGVRHFRVCDFRLIVKPMYTVTDVVKDKDYDENIDICNEKRDQSMFQDKTRYGYVAEPGTKCEPPGNETEDYWASDFATPNPDFHWPDENQGDDSNKQKKSKTNVTAIAIGVSVAVVLVVIAIVVLIFVLKNRTSNESSDNMNGDQFTI